MTRTCMVYHENLKFYLEHGMVLKKVHEAVLYMENHSLTSLQRLGRLQRTTLRKIFLNSLLTVILVNSWKLSRIGIQ